MPNEPPAVYWDACCFIGRIAREPDKIADLEMLTEQAKDGKLIIVTSTLTISEVLHEPSEELAASNKFKTINDFFDHPWIVLRALDRRTAEIAAQVRRDFALKSADAIHVATAIRWRRKVLELHTYDEDHLLKKNGKIGVPPLKIIRPRYPEDHPLFDKLPEVGTQPALEGPAEQEKGESDEARSSPDSVVPEESAQESPADLSDESVELP
jgi:predicted nucleic acid-binding protein